MSDDTTSPYAGKVVVVMDMGQFSALLEQLWVCDYAHRGDGHIDDMVRQLASQETTGGGPSIIRSLWTSRCDLPTMGRATSAHRVWDRDKHPFQIVGPRWPELHIDFGCSSGPAIIDISTKDATEKEDSK